MDSPVLSPYLHLLSMALRAVWDDLGHLRGDDLMNRATMTRDGSACALCMKVMEETVQELHGVAGVVCGRFSGRTWWCHESFQAVHCRQRPVGVGCCL